MPARTLNEAEFARLYQAHARALWCVAVAILGHRESAEDVLQESALVGLQKRTEFTPGSSFVHWMSQIVRYTALNAGRRQRLRQFSGLESGAEPADHSMVEPSPEAREPFDDRVLAALATLDETARTCLLMRTVLEYSYQQITEVLQIPEGTAMSHVHRSRQRLRTILLASEQAASHANHRNGRSKP
jgi:RNA polymerase sigma-70 factor (ECF subfamily)